MIDNKQDLEQYICKNWDEVNKALCEKMISLPIPLTSSVDIREAVDKIAPVDTNLYPAGFNNLCLLDLQLCTDRLRSYFKGKQLSPQSVMILCESHTKNLFYLNHLIYLKKILDDAGLETLIGSFDSKIFDQSDHVSLKSQMGTDVKIHRALIQDNTCRIQGREIDFIVMNNDQSVAIDLPWSRLKTPISPSPLMGWHRRSKVEHFECYHQIVEEFCKRFNILPSILEARFERSEGLDFQTKDGLESLALQVDSFLEKLGPGKKAFIKASQGTYGMGISVVSSGAEILEMNRRNRNKMDVGKNRLKVSSVLIQESIETSLRYEGGPSEISIYLINGLASGGFLRTNALKDSQSNLNSKGMVFQKFCISEIKQNRDDKAKEALYSVVARLATTAAALETQNTMHKLRGKEL
jgi:glutamate--cysteine ligase